MNTFVTNTGAYSYHFTDEIKVITVGGVEHVLHRIISDTLLCGSLSVGAKSIEAGELGGFIESMGNLPPDSKGWVLPSGIVFGDAVCMGYSRVSGVLCDSAKLGGFATLKSGIISGNAKVGGNAVVEGENTIVTENACVQDYANIRNGSYVSGNSRVFQNAIIDSSVIDGYARVGGFSYVGGNSTVSESAVVCDMAHVSSRSKILGHAFLGGDVIISDGATIKAYSFIDSKKEYYRISTKDYEK